MSQEVTKKQRGWLLPESRGREINAGLYLVATPIGNLGDITLRALDILAQVDLVLCEDTRVSGKLLSHYGIKNTLQTYNDFSETRQRSKIVKSIADGKSIALISDAGMPLISDPGYKLVQECTAQNVSVTSLPGANAPLTALQLSGLPSDSFSFLGFLPPKETARKKLLEQWQAVQAPLIVFESGNRLLKALEDINIVLGQRDIAVARELTKIYEEIKRGTTQDLIAFYTAQGLPKGEIVMVIGKPAARTFSDDDILNLLKKALQDKTTKEAAAYVAIETGRPRKELYALALKVLNDEL